MIATAQRWIVFTALGALALAAGCGSDGALTGDPVPNTPPETEVTASPPVLAQTEFTVGFNWTGSDPDGEVLGFEWRISNNGPDGMVSEEDTLQANLPWNFTFATDSLFVVSAELDSFPIDVADTNQSSNDYRFWQTHTFFIRAIDREGLRDPSPATVSFTATTLAPGVEIDVPTYIDTNTCVSAARVLTFGWTGTDPDNPEDEPESVRYLLVPTGTSADPCITRVNFQANASSFIDPDNPNWSEWLDYDAPEEEGKTITLPRQEVGNSFLFVVQARDVAGAVTPTFVWGRNVRHVRIGIDKFPQLVVSEQFLGSSSFVSTNLIKSFEIVSGQPLEFSWNATADAYAGVIEDYRYGFNVTDPNDPNDPGWSVAWGNGPNWLRALPRSFSQGSPNFVVQCRDNSGTITRAFYQFQVIQIATPDEQRDLLLVDDWRTQSDPESQALEANWDLQFERIMLNVKNFQRSDVIDAQEDADRLNFGLVNEYKSVFWFTNGSDQSFFHTRLAPLERTLPRYNWLEVYQARVGNLFFVGPAAMYNSIERDPPAWQFPIPYNVPASPALGFGTQEQPDGSVINVGTLRWPYSAWCLETTSIVRPAFTFIFGEPAGRPVRNDECDGLQYAHVSDQLYANYGSAVGQVVDLAPTIERTSKNSRYQLRFEEFYNRNPTTRDLSISPRTCQTPMFQWVARRDVDEFAAANPSLNIPAAWNPNVIERACPTRGLSTGAPDSLFNQAYSALHLATTGVMSSVYADTKQLRGAEDVVWGFHPLAFQTGGVQSAILWVFADRWQLDLN